MVSGPDQFTPSLLVQADTLKASSPLPVCAYAAITQAPAAFNPRLGAPDGVDWQPAGGCAGDDHGEACADTAITLIPIAIIREATEEPLSFKNRYITNSFWINQKD
jgi:hypothetical protein